MLPRVSGARPARHALADREVPEVLRGGLRQGRLRGWLRRRRPVPADLPEAVVHRGLQHRRAQRPDGREVPGQADRERSLGPARGRGRPQAARGGREALRPEGRQALHGRVAQRLAWVEAHGPRVAALPGEVPGARDQEHPRAQGPDDLAAGQGRLRCLRRRPRGDELPRAQLHRRARRPAADRGLLLHGDAGAERLRGPGGRDRWADARPSALLRQGHGRAALLGRRGQDALRQRLRHLGAQVAGRGLRRLELPGGRGVLGLSGARDRREEEDHGPQRGQALRRRGPAGAAAAARRGR